MLYRTSAGWNAADSLVGPAEILPEGPRMDSSFVLLQFVFSEL